MAQVPYESVFNNYFNHLGMECHPFLVGWYNQKVGEKFKLSHFKDETLAFVIISQPSMFEKTFIPYLRQSGQTFDNCDPLDACMRQTFDGIRSLVGEKVTIFHDFQLWPNRRPKILVQTAAYVSGAVQYFQESDVTEISLLSDIKSKKIYPVCLHPKFGGWFAIRGVVVLNELTYANLPEKHCQLQLPQTEIAKLLRLYNDHWQDWQFRDVVESYEKYSDLQINYFNTKPAERLELITDLKQQK